MPPIDCDVAPERLCARAAAAYHVRMTRGSTGSAARLPAWAVDALIGVGVTLVVSAVIAADAEGGRLEAWAYLWAVGLGGLMLVRRRHPVLVVILSLGALISYYAAGFPPIGVAVPLAAAVFSAAQLGRVAVAVAASAAVLVISVGYRLGVGQDPAFVLGYDLPGHALLLAGAIALGDSFRSRAELRERAAQISRLTEERVARAAQERVTAERLEIARDLHDSVGHALTVISLHTQVVEEAMEAGDDELAGSSLEVVRATASATLGELRATVAGLRREGSGPPPRLSDLGALVEPAEAAGLEVASRVTVPPDLPVQVESGIYRIVQEALTNVARHSDATRVRIEVEAADGAVRVTVADNGSATGTTGAEPGHGIGGMRERAELLGGSLDAGIAPHGFVVRAIIPVAGA